MNSDNNSNIINNSTEVFTDSQSHVNKGREISHGHYEGTCILIGELQILYVSLIIIYLGFIFFTPVLSNEFYVRKCQPHYKRGILRKFYTFFFVIRPKKVQTPYFCLLSTQRKSAWDACFSHSIPPFLFNNSIQSHY